MVKCEFLNNSDSHFYIFLLLDTVLNHLQTDKKPFFYKDKAEL